jgi:hypothetical protein
MNNETLEALKGSVKKWEAIVAGIGVDDGIANCPLCQMFNAAESTDSCIGCPVALRTAKPYCKDIPYGDWYIYTRPRDFPKIVITERDRLAAQAELDFLNSPPPTSHPHTSPGDLLR